MGVFFLLLFGGVFVGDLPIGARCCSTKEEVG